uniref:RING-type domain-containing protein n=1 Tax=Davidia involucrata TaxID=16924 RepID=A0A5B7A622_DAVIN
MGSSSSKTNAAESSSSGVRRYRFKGSRIFHSSCLVSSSGSHDSDNDEQVSDHQIKENDNNIQCTNQNMSNSDQVKAECYRKVKVEEPDETTCISSSINLDEWGQSSLSDTVSRAASGSSRAFSTRSLNPSSRFLSRFSFCPGNVSFRLNRATSLGSSRAYPVSSTSFTIPNNEEELHLQIGPASGLVNRNETPQDRDLLPACLSNRSPTPQYEDFASGNLRSPSTSGFSVDLRDDQITSTQDVARDMDTTRAEFNANLHSPRNHTETEGIETRQIDRRSGAREPVERNVRFSRTLSVGRLRDRVLRRSSFPDLAFCPLQQEREVRDASQGDGRQTLGGETGASVSHQNALVSSTSSGYAPSGMSSSLYSSQDYEVETSRAREARHHDLLEHRSNFLERRRRIRSQVRALQRLGSRFGNLSGDSGHERSCILSGQHRTGHCTCRNSTRDANSNDDTSARASVSRIVMLAEALFEVLDEIHQQSVVLSSQPSVSSIGSVPAPIEVVESLPVKLYSKLQKHLNEEAAQCYICLVEYEEGDSMRILPCHHEFHRTCIDKWLKEIHRVCPLCRGDICTSDSLPAEN